MKGQWNKHAENSGRKIRKEGIFLLENEIFRQKNARVLDVHAARHD